MRERYFNKRDWQNSKRHTKHVHVSAMREMEQGERSRKRSISSAGNVTRCRLHQRRRCIFACAANINCAPLRKRPLRAGVPKERVRGIDSERMHALSWALAELKQSISGARQVVPTSMSPRTEKFEGQRHIRPSPSPADIFRAVPACTDTHCSQNDEGTMNNACSTHTSEHYLYLLSIR